MKNHYLCIIAFCGFNLAYSQVAIKPDNQDLNQEQIPEGILDLRNINSAGQTYPLVIPSLSNPENLLSNFSVGSIYFHSTENKLKLFNGTEWISL